MRNIVLGWPTTYAKAMVCKPLRDLVLAGFRLAGPSPLLAQQLGCCGPPRKIQFFR